ncbi:MAG: M13 family peptidase, partial [Acidobacteriaceae bacterium]|nr:M13 family peptidase [Acidobacteriaceae bacterium]
MRFCLLLVTAARLVLAQDAPLTSLPYTPVLDTQFMDKTADPCTNFYQYACGNWNKLNPIPPDQDRWSVYGKLTYENQRFLWGLLEQASQPSPTRTANEQKIGDYFHACMNAAAVEELGLKPVQAELAQIANLRTIDDLPAYIAGQHRQGIDRDVLFSFGSGQDYDDSSHVIAFASAGGLGLPDRDYYTKTDAKSDEIRKHYVQHIERMLELIGESGPDAQADAQSIMTTETALAQASLTRVEKRDPYKLKHAMSRENLDGLTPAFDWRVYLDKLGAPEFQKVNVTEPKFFGQLNALLQKQNLAGWRAYLRWHLIHSRAP